MHMNKSFQCHPARQHVPRLFGDKAKLLIWTGARNALDDTLWGENTTLNQKYKEKPLYDAVRLVCKEALERMELSGEEVAVQFNLLDGLNHRMREIFVRASARSKGEGRKVGSV